MLYPVFFMNSWFWIVTVSDHSTGIATIFGEEQNKTIFFCCVISILRQEKRYISFVLQQNKYSFLLFVFIHGVTNTLDIMERLKKDCILYCRFANAVCYILADAPDKMLFYKQALLTKYKAMIL